MNWLFLVSAGIGMCMTWWSGHRSGYQEGWARGRKLLIDTWASSDDDD